VETKDLAGILERVATLGRKASVVTQDIQELMVHLELVDTQERMA
jgi:hypothetical protein